MSSTPSHISVQSVLGHAFGVESIAYVKRRIYTRAQTQTTFERLSVEPKQPKRETNHEKPIGSINWMHYKEINEKLMNLGA